MTDDELLVRADELQQRGDPLGELIVVADAYERERTPERSRRLDALIAIQKQRLDDLLGASLNPRYRWRRGLVDTIDFDFGGRQAFDALPKLAEDPAMERLRSLRVTAWQYGDHDMAPIFRELAQLAHRFPCLAEIVVSDAEDTGEGVPTQIGAISRLCSAYPRLEVLELHGRGLALEPIDLPAVRKLVLADLRPEHIRRIVAAQLPRLVDLHLAFGRFRMGNIPATVGPLLHREFPELESLRLEPPASALAYVIGELATCPLVRSVRRLGLRGFLDDAAIDVLVAAAPVLRLEELELVDSALTASRQQHLRRVYGRALDVRTEPRFRRR